MRRITPILLLGALTCCTPGESKIERALIENNQILGSLQDDRPLSVVAEDMAHTEKLVYTPSEWIEAGIGVADLYGWDDNTIPEYVNDISKDFPEFAEDIEGLVKGRGTVTYRIKEVGSLAQKIRQRNLTERLYSMYSAGDIAGLRVIFDQLEDIAPFVQELQEKYDVFEVEDYITEPQNGYRSVHLGIDYDELIVETQVRTIGMDIWSNWNHDIFYKTPEGLREEVGEAAWKEFERYSLSMAEYIHGLELGQNPARPARPERLEVILDFIDSDHRHYFSDDGSPNLDSM